MILFDIDKEMISAWKKHFKNEENIDIKQCSVKDIYYGYNEEISMVTAGNSYGIMTGGIDLAVRDLYGYGIQDIIQNKILRDGPIAIGDSFCLGSFRHPNLIYAPTMVTPQKITSDDVFYVFLKILRRYGDNIAVCGLGTGCGMVPADSCARAMAAAYQYWKETSNEPISFDTMRDKVKGAFSDNGF